MPSRPREDSKTSVAKKVAATLGGSGLLAAFAIWLAFGAPGVGPDRRSHRSGWTRPEVPPAAASQVSPTFDVSVAELRALNMHQNELLAAEAEAIKGIAENQRDVARLLDRVAVALDHIDEDLRDHERAERQRTSQ